MLAHNFCQWHLPPVPGNTVLCVGLELEDITAWPYHCASFTTQQEQQEAARYAQAEDAARHLAGRALARRLLHAALGRQFTAEFARTPYGKPFCPETSTDFSISHSGSIVWVALCNCAAVGIDVEKIRPLPDAAELTSQLHPQEREALLCLPPAALETAFYRCWTRKEAVLKAVGMGLSMPLQSFNVRTGPQEHDWILSITENNGCCTDTAPSADAQWTSRDIATIIGYQCSVAAHAPLLDIAVDLAR